MAMVMVREDKRKFTVTPEKRLFSGDEAVILLEAAEEQIATANDLNMDPPDIIYRDHPALLIMIDGEPVLREIENSPTTIQANKSVDQII